MGILIIANPVAGGGRSARESRRLASMLVSRGHLVDLYLTRASGDARRKAAVAGGDADVIVVSGGDGTLNEVLNGLSDPGRTPLALLPMGTANILARELGVAWRAEGVASAIEAGRTRWVDAGRLNGRRFLSVASCGFDAMVIDAVHARRQGSLGWLGYPLPIVHSLLQYRRPRLRAVVDGRVLEGELVVVSNIRNYAGFFRVAEEADCGDGLLDVVMLKRARRVDLVGHAWRAWRGVLSRSGGVEAARGRVVELRSLDRAGATVRGGLEGGLGGGRCDALQVDGDTAGAGGARIEMLGEGVRVIVKG